MMEPKSALPLGYAGIGNGAQAFDKSGLSPPRARGLSVSNLARPSISTNQKLAARKNSMIALNHSSELVTSNHDTSPDN